MSNRKPNGEEYEEYTPHRVDLNILCDGEIVERLTFKEGEFFGAEVHCDDYAIEVVNIE